VNENHDIQPLLARLSGGAALSREQAYQAFECVMSGQASEAQIGALLMALQVHATADGHGPSVDEITGAAQAMRHHVVKLDVPEGIDVVDTCGTGGDHAGTFNISTAAALVAAGAGAHIAKHGNRSVTSKSGSSQVLEQLGVKLDVTAEVLIESLTEARLCFCYAPAHHPAMKHAAPVRKQLGFRTVFNLLGPLTNPAGARRQVIGVFAPQLTEPIAQVLTQLGVDHAMVVHGAGLDEITLAGPTQITTAHNNKVETATISPEDLGLAPAKLETLQVESVEQSAGVIRGVLAGEKGPARDIVTANAAAALHVAGKVDSLQAGVAMATEAIVSGAAEAALNRLVEVTNQ